jgi:hypothetical protein
MNAAPYQSSCAGVMATLASDARSPLRQNVAVSAVSLLGRASALTRASSPSGCICHLGPTSLAEKPIDWPIDHNAKRRVIAPCPGRLMPAGVISASRDHGATGGTIPTAKGKVPTPTVATTLLVAVRITETLADFRLAT